MVWVRLDDSFPQHPKALRVGAYGRDLFTCALCYANRFLTDGFIPEFSVKNLAPGLPNPRRVADLLVLAGLWEKCDGGWRIHDFHDYQPTAAEIGEAQEVKRGIRSAGGRARAAAAKRVRGRFAPAEAPADNQQPAGNMLVPADLQATSRRPAPSRPRPKERGQMPPSVPSEAARKVNGKVPPGYQEAVEFWFREFERTKGAKPQFDRAEGVCLKRLLAAHSLGQVKALITHMLTRTQLRHIRERHAYSLHSLLGSWNELWTEYRARAAAEGEDVPA